MFFFLNLFIDEIFIYTVTRLKIAKIKMENGNDIWEIKYPRRPTISSVVQLSLSVLKNYFQGLFVLVSFYFLSSLFLALALVLSLSLLVVSSLTFRKLSKPRYFCKIRLVWLPPGRRTEEADGSITVQAVCNITVHPLRSAKVGAGMSRTAGRQIF